MHLLETMEGKPTSEIMAPFLEACGVAEGLSFHQDVPGWRYATGYHDDDKGPVQDGRLMFPALAAGGLGTTTALATWLRQLAIAYHAKEGCGPITHRTAV